MTSHMFHLKEYCLFFMSVFQCNFKRRLSEVLFLSTVPIFHDSALVLVSDLPPALYSPDPFDNPCTRGSLAQFWSLFRQQEHLALSNSI